MQKPFEIGLVMAGAVSAGAYTGGVMDFLIQALDAWQKAKDAGDLQAPRHETRLKVMAGTSAGGMTAGIACGTLASDFEPVTDPHHPDPANKLFDSWVKRIDISMRSGTTISPTNPGRYSLCWIPPPWTGSPGSTHLTNPNSTHEMNVAIFRLETIRACHL